MSLRHGPEAPERAVYPIVPKKRSAWQERRFKLLRQTEPSLCKAPISSLAFT